MIGALGSAAVAAAAPAGERYRLGVMAQMYSALPLDEAMARIRKIGYKYVCPSPKHAGEAVFSPAASAAQRKEYLRRMRDAGVTPFISLGGFGTEPHKEGALPKYLAQLDLCAEFGIPVMVGGGPWYYTKFPTVPKRDKLWQEEVAQFFAAMEKAVRHAESIKVTIALKPHTGITARAKDCIDVAKRIQSPNFKIAWDAGNVSFYEGIYPDPDLPDLAPMVKAVCIKDHLGNRGEANFPVPGQGQIDHEAMFRTLFGAGFSGPLAIERVDAREGKKTSPELVDQRLTQAYQYLTPLLDKVTT